MSGLKPRRPRVRLGSEEYENLRKRALARDNWRCQNCGTAENLQVHHIRWRSHLGDDSLDNLITLCVGCHISTHSYSSK